MSANKGLQRTGLPVTGHGPVPVHALPAKRSKIARPRSVALAMIVKNEERCIARALDSVRPHVDRMIVVDTGSTDRTVEIAREHGAQVHFRRWTGDFAAARNASLALADADWTLVLDADEWLVEGGESLDLLRGIDERFVGLIRIFNYVNVGQVELTTAAPLIRVLPKGVRYSGRVHEQVIHKLPIRDTQIKLEHDGYLREQMAKKTNRNRDLLLAAHADNPEDPYVLFQLGKDYDCYAQPADAVEWYAKALPKSQVNLTGWRHDLVIRMMCCLRVLKRVDEGLVFAADEMANYSASADYNFVVGELLLDKMGMQPELGPDLLPMIEASWLRCLEIGEGGNLGGSLHGRGSYLAARNLNAFYRAQGIIDKADYFLNMAEEAEAVAGV